MLNNVRHACIVSRRRTEGNGKHLVVINKDPGSADLNANLVIHQKIGELFELLHV